MLLLDVDPETDGGVVGLSATAEIAFAFDAVSFSALLAVDLAEY